MRATSQPPPSEPILTPRREFIRTAAIQAGVTTAVLHLLDGRAEALPKSEETDIAILNAALAIEHEAIGRYADALSRNLVPAGLRNYAIEFKGAHEGHRDTQVEILRERGIAAKAPHGADPLREVTAGDAVVRRLLSVEAAAEAAYLRLIGQIRTSDYLLSAGFIVVDEARHQIIWRRALGLSIY